MICITCFKTLPIQQTQKYISNQLKRYLSLVIEHTDIERSGEINVDCQVFSRIKKNFNPTVLFIIMPFDTVIQKQKLFMIIYFSNMSNYRL